MKRYVLFVCLLLSGLAGVYAQSIAPFQKGDRIAFVGNSITCGGHYHSYIWLYYMTRFPDQRIDIFNEGVGEDVAEMIYQRLDKVFEHEPTVVTLSFGMNDVGYMDFRKPGADTIARNRVEKACRDYALIEEVYKKYPEVRKILIGSSPYDETSRFNKVAFPGKNTPILEIVDFLNHPDRYKEIGAQMPKGALLVGPPGTGKTLLAKAVAGEANVPFFSLSGSEFVEMFVGVGASRVRDLFEEAKKNAPCIVFIDEIDTIGKKRDGAGFSGNDEREQTLNQLLAEMDGFDTSKGLLILAATNRPEVLDPALLRPGRFDRRIIVDRPDLKGRVEILKVHAKNVMLDETVNLEAIALATSGAVGSDLANMINEAAILAVKNGRRAVSQKDLQESVEVVLVGKEKKDRILSPQERKIVSYHEVGHALVNALQKDAEPVQKITIVPRTMGALGYVMQVPEEEKYLNTQKELEAMLVGYLGGRAAEEIVFDTVTTGAANDIEQATKVARAMITQYGMSQKFGLMGLASQENQYLSGRAVLNCGDDTATEIDHEVMQLLHYSYEEAKRLLNEHREALDKIAGYLISRETITGKEFMKIFRAVEKGLEIPENLDDLPDEVQTTADRTAVENTEGLTAEETPAEPVHEISAVDVTETDNDESDSEE